MDKDALISNIERFARSAGVSPSRACISAGLSKNFLSEVKRGRMPNVAAIADLASFLGVSTSDLVGDVRELPPQLLQAWSQLNDEGREKLTDYAEDLAASGRYIKNRPSELDAQTDVS